MNVTINGVQYVPAPNSKLKRQPFAELIAKARGLAHETLDDAGIAIGTTKSYLWALEAGRSQPTLGLLQVILKHYGLSFEQIAPESKRTRKRYFIGDEIVSRRRPASDPNAPSRAGKSADSSASTLGEDDGCG